MDESKDIERFKKKEDPEDNTFTLYYKKAGDAAGR